jgi:ATP-dependent Lon protease
MADNKFIVLEALDKFRNVAAPFVAKTLVEQFGEEWWTTGILGSKMRERQTEGLDSSSISAFTDSLDAQACLNIMSYQHALFINNKDFPRVSYSWIGGLMDYRNKAAHSKGVDFTSDDTEEALRFLYRLCEKIDTACAEELKLKYQEYRKGASSSLGTVSGNAESNETVEVPDAETPQPKAPAKTEHVREPIEPLQSSDTDVDLRLRDNFEGKIVRKDLTAKIRQGANVPTYVLEYLLGQYCTSRDNETVADGVETVKSILSKNFVRPDEAQKILSILRERGSHTVIDKLEVHLNTKTDTYEAHFSNLGIKEIPIASLYVTEYDRLLCGGIWCIVRLEYDYVEEDKRLSPIHISELTPIQMPHVDMEEVKEGRKAFTKEEWMRIMLRSTGMEPDRFTEREKWLLLLRLVPLVENNYNLCELGPRSTGKSHIYKEVSPNSILVSGGQTTVANLFYSMTTKTVGLVGLWDCVAFDEVAGIKFKDNDGVQIMKDYMASGSFARGKEEKAAKASMVFVGNINQSVDVLLKSSHLFDPFPPVMGNDTAFLDRMHCYLPGWEIPKFRPESFTNDYGFITDYLSEFVRELRKEQCSDVLDKYFKLGRDLNQRDTIAVRKTVSGLTKLMYPDGVYTKEEIGEILTLALEMRRRVKEQLKKIGGMEFYDVNFSYIDLDTFEEHYVSPPEQGGGKLIPDGQVGPGQIYTISRAKNGMIGVYRLETQILPGNGKLSSTGVGSDREAKESIATAFNYLKANGGSISKQVSTTTKDYIVNYQDLHGNGITKSLALPTLIAICSAALNRQPISGLAVLGEITVAGSIIKVDELANVLQVCLDAGAKKVLLPITSAGDLGQVPSDLVGAFSLIFYSTPQEAVFKALGVD